MTNLILAAVSSCHPSSILNLEYGIGINHILDCGNSHQAFLPLASSVVVHHILMSFHPATIWDVLTPSKPWYIVIMRMLQLEMPNVVHCIVLMALCILQTPDAILQADTLEESITPAPPGGCITTTTHRPDYLNQWRMASTTRDICRFCLPKMRAIC
jgi:hypothetical protein